jgi:non-canonical (house-cleaning) NTP pyrophosphatase
MRVVVTTANPEKLAAVARAFNNVFGMDDIIVESLPSDSSISHGQPWGLQHTFEGAMARISDASFNMTLIHTADFIVSPENGVCTVITHRKTHAIDICCVVIEHVKTGQHTFSFSQSRPFPLDDVQIRTQDGESHKDIGAYCEDFYRKLGPTFSRTTQIVTATTTTLEQILQLQLPSGSPIGEALNLLN